MKNLTICIFYFLCVSIGLITGSHFILNQQIQTSNLQHETIIDSLKTIKMKERVTVTAYHPKSYGINSDSDPTRTAIMKRPIPGYTFAISTSLVEAGWLNRIIYLDGIGIGKATDRMGRSIKGNHIDICKTSLKKAKMFGMKKNILAVVLD
ncbi:MAG: 3D domain-containing protein [Candidatus Micrarchaeota archaeon]